jgi:hypothetical protein
MFLLLFLSFYPFLCFDAAKLPGWLKSINTQKWAISFEG